MELRSVYSHRDDTTVAGIIVRTWASDQETTMHLTDVVPLIGG